MKRKALFVGVNTYEDEQIRDLDFSLSDAHALKTLFELFGFESDILENPNKSDVFHAVRQMTAGLGTGDLFFFYFAGHGWTTTSGKHLLFCSDDMYEDLRDDDAGISFDKLKRKTTGDYNRAFVLDACRSDFITGTRGGDTTTRDLRPIGELVKDAPVKSSLAVLRSCSQYEHALEIRSRKHGLFTLAMMEVLRTSKDCGRELLFGEALCDAVTDKMLCIAKAEGITAEQTPEFAKTGSAQVLIEESRAAIPSMAMPTVGAQNFVVCPICGKHNDVTDTFKCPVCGKDHLCLSHQSKDSYSCPSCAEKKLAAKAEAEIGGVQLWAGGPYWAECNVGATKPEETGWHFWWGDTAGYKRNSSDNGWVSVKNGEAFSFDYSNCHICEKDIDQLKSAGYIDATGNLVAAYDAATVHWGAPWRMPTAAEFELLVENCDTEWTARNGVAGRLVRGRGAYSSRSIFLPAAGFGSGSCLDDLGSYGDYWSSTPLSGDSDDAWTLYFYSGDFGRSVSLRNYGQSVRPVRGFAK